MIFFRSITLPSRRSWNFCISVRRIATRESDAALRMPGPGTGPHKRGRGTSKTPVVGLVERGGNVHRRVVADVSASTLKGAIRECVDTSARIMTDENLCYRGIGREFAGGHIASATAAENTLAAM